MIVIATFKDISRRIALINRESYLVKICVVVTPRHIICVDTDNKVEFFRTYVDNVNGFYKKLWMLYQAMLNFDYCDLGKIRPHKTNSHSNKFFELWKQANEKKLSTLL